MNHWQRRAKIAENEALGALVEPAAYPGWGFRVRRRCQWNALWQSALARASLHPHALTIAERRAANPDAPFTDEDRAIDAMVSREAFAEGCVASWQGVTDEKGKPLAFNTQNVCRVLEAFPDIYADLTAASVDPAKFLPIASKAKAEIVEGN